MAGLAVRKRPTALIGTARNLSPTGSSAIGHCTDSGVSADGWLACSGRPSLAPLSVGVAQSGPHVAPRGLAPRDPDSRGSQEGLRGLKRP
eukprot:74780-Prymnesium_polylepis.1